MVCVVKALPEHPEGVQPEGVHPEGVNAEGVQPDVVREQTTALLVEHVAARVNQVLVEAQEDRGRASLALTGGPLVITAIQALAASTRTAEFVPDWSCVDLWWCEEYFLPQEHPQRNAQRAAAASENFMLLSQVPPENVHVIGDSDQFFTAEDAAADYLAELKAAADADGNGGEFPIFDIALLGVGAHQPVAAQMSGSTGAQALDLDRLPEPGRVHEATVVVCGSHQEPSPLIAMTLPLISTSHHLWMLASDAQEVAAAQQLVRNTTAGGSQGLGVSGQFSTVLFTTSED